MSIIRATTLVVAAEVVAVTAVVVVVADLRVALTLQFELGCRSAEAKPETLNPKTQNLRCPTSDVSWTSSTARSLSRSGRRFRV